MTKIRLTKEELNTFVSEFKLGPKSIPFSAQALDFLQRMMFDKEDFTKWFKSDAIRITQQTVTDYLRAHKHTEGLGADHTRQDFLEGTVALDLGESVQIHLEEKALNILENVCIDKDHFLDWYYNKGIEVAGKTVLSYYNKKR